MTRLITAGTLVLIFAVGLAFSAHAWADSLTLGTADPNTGDCAPWGCTPTYQQVYSAASFGSSPITITGLTFFGNNYDYSDGSDAITAGNYKVYLSTTSAAVNGLSSTFANNVGADETLFFSGYLSGSQPNGFTLNGSFNYDPGAGNLLMYVLSDAPGATYTGFFATASSSGGQFSRLYSFHQNATSGTLSSNSGLVTEFTYSTSVPEPATLPLLGMGLVALLGLPAGRRLLAQSWQP